VPAVTLLHMEIKSNRSASRAVGFTMAELLVVMAILMILAMLLFPVVTRALGSGKQVKCLNHLHTQAVAAHMQYTDVWPELPNRGPFCTDWGAAADGLVPYLKGDLSVFDCPANPGDPKPKGPFGTQLTNNPSIYTEYEFNGFLSRCDAEPVSQERRQPLIVAPAQCALAYDFPYLASAPNRPHQGGINVAYLDGHAAWLPDEEQGDVVWPFGEDAFFLKGHPWR
jgi:prepilin-type processing-associated H-X9-DG protein